MGGSYAKRAVGHRIHIHCPDDRSVCEEGTLRDALGWPGIGAYILSDEGRPSAFSHDNLCFSLMPSGRLVER